MKIYFAGPLFSAAERDWNVALAGRLRAAGHDVYLAQENEPGKSAPEIFAVDVAGIGGADCQVAIMDGPDPDSGTAWEVGYAYGKGMPSWYGPTSGKPRAAVPVTTPCWLSRRRSASMCQERRSTRSGTESSPHSSNSGSSDTRNRNGPALYEPARSHAAGLSRPD